ncbi:zinc-dependent alcohol dehydrogenase family protein [Salinibacterium sp. NK8237]|uniref:zinc-dependent alcohol dehydrogenase family protein n=1 Tax=Salinibacterium sp. NK8237 TaxID=2792038 RepID=UPI0018CE9804|nr:zinc-dependent alcohol dehydrogenase family protein [Salinibacterium sp. NK8237]MBH0128937.1 zinc-dependent alcohol dehydrogenase family protein [Salinibacterium sp. NK8237]
MKAWITGESPGSISLGTKPKPMPDADEVVVQVIVCGLCRTDLHVVDQELETHTPHVTPGHQVVGTVVALGDQVKQLSIGDTVGVAWLRRTCGVCEWCRSGRENLCPNSEYTGWDADGGFAEYATVPEAFAYLLPADVNAVEVAPLLCAGIIGYRALSRAALPDGGKLGIYGYGSSGHITAQIAQAAGATIYAMTRGGANQDLARSIGSAFVGDETEEPPEKLDAAIVFAPVGEFVPVALAATKRGGTVVLAGIHMTDIPAMNYQADLFNERDLRTVTANTRADGATFLTLAHNLAIRPTVTTYPFDEVDVAISDLRSGNASGSIVITMPNPSSD